MTVPSEVSRNAYIGTGLFTGYGTGFVVQDAADLLVSKTEIATGTITPMFLGADYSVTLDVSGFAGVNATVPATHRINIIRDPRRTQLADYTPNDPFPAETHEAALDRVTMIGQRNFDLIKRCLRAPDGDQQETLDLPNQVYRAGKYLAFDGVGQPIVLPGTVALVVQDVTAFYARSTGPSTTDRFLSDRFADIRNVMDYGALGNDAANDTVAINLCISKLPIASGGIVYFPSTTQNAWRVDTITLDRPIHLWGQGCGTTLRARAATGDTINVTSADCEIQGFRFDSAIARTAGSFINIGAGGHRCKVHSFLMLGAFVGIKILSLASVRVHHGDIRNTVGLAGAGCIWIAGGNDHYIDSVTSDASAGAQPEFGVRVTNCGFAVVSNCDFIHSGHDLDVVPGNGESVASLYCHHTCFDTAVRGINIFPTGTGTVLRCRFTTCWASSNTFEGVRISGAAPAVVAGVDILGLTCHANGSHGAVVNFGIDINFQFGAYNASAGDGIRIAANINDFSVLFVRSGASASAGPNTGWGLNVLAGVSDNFRVYGNDFRFNTTGAFFNGGTGNTREIRDNIGYRTRSSGSATILSGTTSIVINHNLSLTPKAEDFSIVNKENSTYDPGSVYIDTIGATQATIRCRSDPGASNLDIGWNCDVNFQLP